MSFINLAKYKTLSRLSGSALDTTIELIIDLIEPDIKIFCNHDFAEGWPEAMQLYQAKMITYHLDGLGSGAGKMSESQGGYSYTNEDLGSSGYPLSIEKGLGKWRRVSAKYPQAMTQWRDRRLQSLKDLTEKSPYYGGEKI